MTRTEIVAATYEGAERLNAAKARYGRITRAQATKVAGRLRAVQALRARLEPSAAEALDPSERQALVAAARALAESTINDKAELFPPRAFLQNFRIGGVLRLLFGELLRHLTGRRP